MLEGKALITGASGFIGGNLRQRLLDDGVDVLAIRRPGSPPAKQGRSVVAKYDDKAALQRVIADEAPDYIFHVAGSTKGRTYDDFERANVMPTRNLIAACEGHDQLRRFVLVSSLTSYGPTTARQPLREEDARRPIEFYGQSKLAAERVVEASGIPWSIVRPGGVYGPGDVDYFELFRSTAKGLNLFYGNRQRWMSVIYVDDCISGIVAAAHDEAAIGEGYFLTDDEPITWQTFQQSIVDINDRRVLTLDLPEKVVDVAAIAGELLSRIDGKPRLLNRQKAAMGAQEAWLGSGSKAREQLGFSARVRVGEGVRLTDRWYRDNRWY